MGRYQRAAGLFVFGTALGAALLLVALVDRSPRDLLVTPGDLMLPGGVQIQYDASGPAATTIAIAVCLAAIFAGSVCSLERWVATRARRSEGGTATPLAPRIIMAETRNVFAGPVTVTVLIPARNEEACLAATIASLRDQTRPPERIVIVADNCTDRTVQVARGCGAEVFETTGNRDRKAGGLNQALAGVLPSQGDNDLVMVMDADTVLGRRFLEHAVRRMTDDRALMAIGGLFYGESGGGLLGQFQRNEYTRYARDLRRRRGLVLVLTGTASVFRPRALRTVAAERGRLIPGAKGQYFDTAALTEDNEITLALKSLGALVVSPAACAVVTEIMTSWRALWVQRLRWQRGAVENLGAYGLRSQTWRYWLQQVGLGYGVFALTAYLGLMVLTALALNTVIWFPFWLGIGAVFAAERVLTVWRGGWPARLLAITVFPELFYSLVLAVVWLKGVLDLTRARAATWHYGDRLEVNLEAGL